MSEFNLNVGDKVYYPTASNEVSTLADAENSRYPVMITLENGAFYSFTIDGKYHKDDLNPVAFPATQEWYEKLVQVYPDLEPPPKRKEPREIIEAMLSDNWNAVPCYVHNKNKTPYKLNRRELILEMRDYGENPFFSDTTTWKYATPFDPRTGKTIVDYVNGEVVLGD